MIEMTEKEFAEWERRRSEKLKENRRIKSRKARLRNGTAACGETLKEKLAYLEKAKRK